MRFLQYSIFHIFALFVCITITNAAVICIDESSLDKVLPTGVDKVNVQRRNATAVSDEDETAEIGIDVHSHTDTGVAFNGTHHSQSQVTKFLQTVQDTLEKAKPWVVEIEKEAKRLEETAKRFSVGVIRDLGKFVDRLIGGGNSVGGSVLTPSLNSETSTSSPAPTINADNKTHAVETTTAAATVAEVLPDVVVVSATDAVVVAPAAVAEVSDAENEISGQQDDNTLCPDGFEADINGICLRNHK